MHACMHARTMPAALKCQMGSSCVAHAPKLAAPSPPSPGPSEGGGCCGGHHQGLAVELHQLAALVLKLEAGGQSCQTGPRRPADKHGEQVHALSRSWWRWWCTHLGVEPAARRLPACMHRAKCWRRQAMQARRAQARLTSPGSSRQTSDHCQAVHAEGTTQRVLCVWPATGRSEERHRSLPAGGAAARGADAGGEGWRVRQRAPPWRDSRAPLLPCRRPQQPQTSRERAAPRAPGPAPGRPAPSSKVGPEIENRWRCECTGTPWIGLSR